MAHEIPAPTYKIPNTVGQTIPGYALRDEATVRYGIRARAAHDTITTALEQAIADLGREKVVVDERPVNPDRPEPHGESVDTWLIVTQEAANLVRDALAKTYGAI